LSSYERALALVQQEPERRFLEERLRRLEKDFEAAVDFLSLQRL
jgi:predicted RNA polymerase sigma factor